MRQHREEVEFGSDSFLDVLANLVGILIILIVAVGVRIAKMPPEELRSAQAESKQAVQPVEIVPEIAAVSPVKTSSQVVLPPRELPPLPRFGSLPEIRPTEEMLTQAAQLKTRYDALIQERTELDTLEALLKSQLTDGQSSLQSLQTQLDQTTTKIQKNTTEVSELEQNVSLLRSQVAVLKQQADEINLEEAHVEKLQHHLPPVGRVVSGDEVHFRLQGNRITYVPLNELVREVQQEMERRKEILLNRSFFQGATRPVEGYMMEYVMQRMVDEQRYGHGMIRIGVSSWVVKPVGPLKQETAEEAMRAGSHFMSVLGRQGPTTTVTFWVYPDSFDAHSKLKAFTHDAGYWIASRPLPTGVPIAGSPQGSKSVAQ